MILYDLNIKQRGKMTSPIQPDKTYGVLHTESFFSFLGFAKKIGSDETQKIDVYLDDKLIDTIEANEFIQKIDDMYDVESKAFTYNLPVQYIDKKAIISFKNHDSGEELLNSPYTLIDKNHEKFNEAKFMHSLNQPISDEMKNMFKPNSIGFLAIKENLEDEAFMGYIKELMIRFPDVEFKGFCFDDITRNDWFNKKNISICKISSVKFIRTQLFIFNAIETYDNLSSVNKKINELLLSYFKMNSSTLPLQSNYNLYDKDLRKQGNLLFTLFEKSIISFFNIQTINKYDKNFYLFLFQSFFDDYNIEKVIDLSQNALEFSKYTRIHYLLKYDILFKRIKEFELERLKK